MRAVIQRVSKASVQVPDVYSAAIGKGMLVLIGVEEDDSEVDLEWLSAKISKLRIFDDPDGVMNLSVAEISGEILVISQFTLHASTRKGNRPSYIRAAKPEKAVPLYERFVEALQKDSGRKVLTGIFGAHMDVQLINDGPVTIIIDTKWKE